MPKNKKRLDWCCNVCDDPRRLFGTLQEVIAHYRKEHPDDGYGLYNIGGDLGDPVGNSAMKRMWGERAAYLQRENEARNKAKLYDELLARWNALCRALHIGQSAMDAYREAYEKEKK